MVDINELARQSGVSAATVSRALNGRPEVSASTRQRILDLARELGYSPNASARTLARRRSHMVGLVWDTGYRSGGQRHPFLQDLLVGFKEALSTRGYALLLLPIPSQGGPDDDADAYLRLARAHSLEGVLIMGIDEHTPKVATLVGSEVPCVAIDLDVAGPRSSYVTSDNQAGAAGAVEHLLSLGHRRVATITGPLDMKPGAERLAGYRAALAAAGLPERPGYVATGDFFPASGHAAMRRLLALDEPPTAVFVAGDAMAIAAMNAAQEAGLSVPADLAVVGFDDIEAAALARPALTTVAQDKESFGSAAVAALSALIAGPQGGDGSPVTLPVVLPTRLVVRQSCGARLP
jgi:LacI family transcriptional regulator